MCACIHISAHVWQGLCLILKCHVWLHAHSESEKLANHNHFLSRNSVSHAALLGWEAPVECLLSSISHTLHAPVPGGWADRRGAASVVQSVPVAESLTRPPLILDGGLVVGDDGDDVFFKEGWSSSVFNLPTTSKRRPCVSPWLVVGPVSRLEADPPLSSVSLSYIHFLQLTFSLSISSHIPQSLSATSLPVLISFSLLSFLSASLCFEIVISDEKRMTKKVKVTSF